MSFFGEWIISKTNLIVLQHCLKFFNDSEHLQVKKKKLITFLKERPPPTLVYSPVLSLQIIFLLLLLAPALDTIQLFVVAWTQFISGQTILSAISSILPKPKKLLDYPHLLPFLFSLVQVSKHVWINFLRPGMETSSGETNNLIKHGKIKNSMATPCPEFCEKGHWPI